MGDRTRLPYRGWLERGNGSTDGAGPVPSASAPTGLKSGRRHSGHEKLSEPDCCSHARRHARWKMCEQGRTLAACVPSAN